jgi:hypothetical protein
MRDRSPCQSLGGPKLAQHDEITHLSCWIALSFLPTDAFMSSTAGLRLRLDCETFKQMARAYPGM